MSSIVYLNARATTLPLLLRSVERTLRTCSEAQSMLRLPESNSSTASIELFGDCCQKVAVPLALWSLHLVIPHGLLQSNPILQAKSDLTHIITEPSLSLRFFSSNPLTSSRGSASNLVTVLFTLSLCRYLGLLCNRRFLLLLGLDWFLLWRRSLS